MDIASTLKDKISLEPTAELASEMLSTAKDLYAECERLQAALSKSIKS
jgi:hypothetical protein